MPASRAGGRLLLLPLLLVSACGSGVPGREGEVDLTIEPGGPGTPASTNPFGNSISGLAIDATHRIWIADAAGGNVRVFASDGAFQFAVTGMDTPAGPFLRPCCVTFDSQHRLWVRDGGNARYVTFRPGEADARFLFSMATASGEPANPAPITFDPDGNLIHVREGSGDAVGSTRLHLDSLGTAVDTLLLPAIPRDSLGYLALQSAGAIWFLQPPFGPQDLLAHAPGGDFARAISSRYIVARYAADGTLRHEIRVDDARSPRLDREQRAVAENQLFNDANRMGMVPAVLTALMPWRNQLLAALYFDRAGRLWVERHVPRGDPRSADVYDRDGNLLFRARWPAEIDLSKLGWIAADVAIGVLPDSVTGNARVVRLRFR